MSRVPIRFVVVAVFVSAVWTVGPPAGAVQSPLKPGTVDLTPASPTEVANCIPFGNNTDYGFSGFIYRNVPAFILRPHDEFSFDLGFLNDRDTRRNIYFAVGNKNPHAPQFDGSNIRSQGVRALGWTQVVSDGQVPENPLGDLIVGDYELTYTSETLFRFPGGALLIGFGSSPPGEYSDPGCEQVLVGTKAVDASHHFYARFCLRENLTLAILDTVAGCQGNGLALGGTRINGVLLP